MLELTMQSGSQLRFHPWTIYMMRHYFKQLNAAKLKQSCTPTTHL